MNIYIISYYVFNGCQLLEGRHRLILKNLISRLLFSSPSSGALKAFGSNWKSCLSLILAFTVPINLIFKCGDQGSVCVWSQFGISC